jgi:chromate transporter
VSNDHASVLGVFSALSLMAVGGGAAVLPEMKHLVIDGQHWLSPDQFRDIYALGQLAPGPNMMMVTVIGYHVSGYVGALLAFLGFFVPSCLISLLASRIWYRFEGSPLRVALQRGLTPIVVGLMASGAIAIARTALDGWATAAVAVAVFGGVYFLKQVNPAIFVLASGLLGYAVLS